MKDKFVKRNTSLSTSENEQNQQNRRGITKHP